MDAANNPRIGELAYRVGVRPEVVRARERRYNLLQPARSERGLRLYSESGRNIYLGGDSPPGTVHMAADTVDANVIVLSGVFPDRFAARSSESKSGPEVPV